MGIVILKIIYTLGSASLTERSVGGWSRYVETLYVCREISYRKKIGGKHVELGCRVNGIPCFLMFQLYNYFRARRRH